MLASAVGVQCSILINIEVVDNPRFSLLGEEDKEEEIQRTYIFSTVVNVCSVDTL